MSMILLLVGGLLLISLIGVTVGLIYLLSSKKGA